MWTHIQCLSKVMMIVFSKPKMKRARSTMCLSKVMITAFTKKEEEKYKDHKSTYVKPIWLLAVKKAL